MTPKARSLGFPFLEFGREYDPIEVQIKMPKTTGRDRFGNISAGTYGPFREWTRTWVVAAEVEYLIRQLFIKHPTHGFVYRFNPDKVQILFEAKPFFYLMQNASRANKLIFFRRAVVESIDEVNDFVEMVETSDLSDKDKRRAKTWIYRRIHNHDI